MRVRLPKALYFMGMILFVFEVGAYNLKKGAKWSQAETTMYVDLAGENGLWNTNYEDAMQQWSNATIFKFHSVHQYRNPCNRADKLNGVDWRDTDCGDSFGDGIAVTHLTWSVRTLQFSQTDMIFNSNAKWTVYQGNLQHDQSGGWINDFHRVALHELGHVIGLDHVAQSANSIMVPTISDIDKIMPDDIDGVAALYGSSAANQAPIAAFTASPLSGAAPLSITLDASVSQDPDGVINSYAWSSSDGQSVAGKVSVLTFSQAGTVTITLTVTDNKGLISSIKQNVTVTLASVAALYDMQTGLLTLQDVIAFGQHYYAELQFQADNTFKLSKIRLLANVVSNNPAVYDETLRQLNIPKVSVNGQTYFAELTDNGGYVFTLQKNGKLE